MEWVLAIAWGFIVAALPLTMVSAAVVMFGGSIPGGCSYGDDESER